MATDLIRLVGDDSGWVVNPLEGATWDDPLCRTWDTAEDAMAEIDAERGPHDWWEEEPGCWMGEPENAATEDNDDGN